MPFTHASTHTLRAYRQDGTPVLPGDAITNDLGEPTMYCSATQANDFGRDGKILVRLDDDGQSREVYAAVYGLRTAWSEQPEFLTGQNVTLEWTTAIAGPPDQRRDLAVPGRYWALIGPLYGSDRWEWFVFNMDTGSARVDSGNVATEADAKADVAAWEAMRRAGHSVRVRDTQPAATETGQPEWASVRTLAPSEAARESVRADLADALARVGHFQQDYAPGHADAQELFELRALADVVRSYQAMQDAHAGMAADDAAELARTTAPPRPGITQRMGYTVYAVLPGGSNRAWYVAAIDDQENHVTWLAETSSDSSDPGYGERLVYSDGHYFTRGENADAEAAASLMDRANCLDVLTRLLTSGMVSRETWQEARSEAMCLLTERYNVGRAKAREGVDEATALGSAMVTWHRGGRQHSYEITFNRYRLTYAVRERY